MVCEVCGVFVLIESLPSRYRSTRCSGMGSMNGGWLLVVLFVCVRLTLCVCMSPNCGRSVMRASWSPCSGV